MQILPEVYYPTKAPELRQIGTFQTLTQWRHENRGPAYVKSGSRVLYKGQDLLDWLEATRVVPTAA